jgi:hypothetical protein
MIGFKLNKQIHDIEAVGGKIALLSTVQEAVRQRLDIKFKTWAGEWFLDTTYGIPYRQQILGKGRTKAEIDALYILEINKDPDVQRIVYFNSVFDVLEREYKLDFEVKVADAPLRSTEANKAAWEEIEYSTDDSTLRPSCNFATAADICKLHVILHCKLPACGESTWITVDNGGICETDECFSYVEFDCVDSDYVGFSCADDTTSPPEPPPPLPPYVDDYVRDGYHNLGYGF